MPVFEWFAAHPADAATFSRAMANLTDGIRPGVIAVLRLDGIRTLVDVGGADGSLLAGILVAHPGMSGVGDEPHVADDAAKALARRSVSGPESSAPAGTSSSPSRPATATCWPRSCTTGTTPPPPASCATSPPLAAREPRSCWSKALSLPTTCRTC